MRQNDFEVPLDPNGDGASARGAPGGETSIGELFKRLSTDTAELIRQEASLAKVEIRDTGAALVGDARNVGIAAGLALAGTLCIVAFLVLALGNLLDGRYWLSALIVGAVALVAGMLLAKNAVNDIKTRGLKPQQTLDTLREDKVWAGQAARELGHDLKADPTKTIERR